jgi:acyl carrier protein
MRSVTEKVTDVLIEIGVTTDQITPEARLEDLIDPLDEIEFILMLEEEFQELGPIPINDIDTLTTVQTVIDYVETHLS